MKAREFWLDFDLYDDDLNIRVVVSDTEVPEWFHVREVIKDGIECPFCGEGDFDLYGLKYHLIRWCEPFDNLKDDQPNLVSDDTRQEPTKEFISKQGVNK